jgi:hypothetical protein
VEAYAELGAPIDSLLPAIAAFCDLCAQVAVLHQFIGASRPEPKWRNVAAENTLAISEPTSRIDACCAMLEIDGIYQRTNDAVRWLEEGMAA